MRVTPFPLVAILLSLAAVIPAETTPPEQPAQPGADASAPPPHSPGRSLGVMERLSAYAESPADDKAADAKWADVEEHFKSANKDQFARLDTDGDGHISRAEAAAAVTKMSDRLKDKAPELFAKIDTDGDGKLSHDEIKAALDAMPKHGPPPGGPHDGPPPGHGPPDGAPPGPDGNSPPPPPSGDK